MNHQTLNNIEVLHLYVIDLEIKVAQGCISRKQLLINITECLEELHRITQQSLKIEYKKKNEKTYYKMPYFSDLIPSLFKDSFNLLAYP